jgi:hypothetical protein
MKISNMLGATMIAGAITKVERRDDTETAIEYAESIHKLASSTSARRPRARAAAPSPQRLSNAAPRRSLTPDG